MNTCSTFSSSERSIIPIAKEGYCYIGVSAFVTLYLGALGFLTGALFFLAVTVFVVAFFRDPERKIPEETGAVVSPADGKVIEIHMVDDHEFTGQKMLKMSIFMNVFNVHVNRIPMEATVREIAYFPGKFFSADLDKASKDNERNALHLDLPDGRRAVVVQIAGLIARRIVCRVNRGDSLCRGQRFGIICFGSRVDVYLPPDTTPVVGVGNKVQAGTTILGHLS